MYAGFNLKIEEDDKSLLLECCKEANALYKAQKNEIYKELDNYINVNGSLDADKIEKDWFPNNKYHIFISHSHSDEKLAILLATYLKEKHNINCFIDSCVWGYANDLLKTIDNKYCKRKDKDGKEVYDYDLRNQSTSHVHMLLEGALAKMINQTECLMFLNTPNSLKASDISDQDKTGSAWIYNEILIATEFPHRRKSEHRTKSISHSDEEHRYNLNEDLEIEYPLNTNKLEDLSFNDIQLVGKISQNNAYDFLDNLYEYCFEPTKKLYLNEE